MNPIARGFGRSLGSRIFLLSGALIVASIGGAVAFTAFRAGQIAHQAIDEALDGSQSAQSSFENQRYAQLRLISHAVAGDPSFVAYVAEADPASVYDLLGERRTDLGCDFAIALDPRGRVLARTDRAAAQGEDLSDRPLVATAMIAGEASGLWRERGRLYDAVAVPLLSGQRQPVGLLVTGFAITDALALEVKKVSGAEVAYLTSGADGPGVAASTLGGDAVSLLESLRAHPKPLARAFHGERVPRLDLKFAGRAWVARLTPLQDASGATAGAAVTLASLDQELGPFRRIENTLLFVGLLSMLVAFSLSYSLSRRVTRPIERLVEAAEAAREGDYSRELEVGGEDEVGRLSRAFAGLLGDLREQRDMEAYLSQLTRHLPDAAASGDLGPAVSRVEAALAPGMLFGDRFEILSLIGAGGMGVVYKARDRQLNDVVALKMLPRDAWGDREALDRLKSELRLARRVTNRHVLRTHDFGEIDGVAFISMEYVRGMTLRQLLDESGVLPYAAGLRLARQLCVGLEAAHTIGVLHRDIKPENIVLEPNGNAKLMDFGIAAPARRTRGNLEGGSLTGTPHYLAPEQLQGGEGDARADVYACGVVFYEMFSGRLPFAGTDVNEFFYRQMNEEPQPLRSQRPELPAALEQIVSRCLERDPGQRYASVAALLEDLTRLSTR